LKRRVQLGFALQIEALKDALCLKVAARQQVANIGVVGVGNVLQLLERLHNLDKLLAAHKGVPELRNKLQGRLHDGGGSEREVYKVEMTERERGRKRYEEWARQKRPYKPGREKERGVP
jgi:hypothetical protein